MLQTNFRRKLLTKPTVWWLTWQRLLLAVLMLAVLTSAFAVIYTRDLNRRLFYHLHELHRERDRLHVEWSQLLLEQSTWSTHARVEQIAEDKLHMMIPKAKDVVIIRS